MEDKTNKIVKELWIFLFLTEAYGRATPDDLMLLTHINSRRTLERYICDLRDCGLMNIQYDRRAKRYYYEKDQPAFNTAVTGRKRAHLLRLRRLVELIYALRAVDYGEHLDYLDNLAEYMSIKKEEKKDSETKELKLLYKKSISEYGEYNKHLHGDIKKIYYETCEELRNTLGEDICPEITYNKNERTRQRDFKTLRQIPGVNLYYDKNIKTYVYTINFDDLI